MGQKEVLEFLEKEREQNDNWFRISEIKDALSVKGLSHGAIKVVNKNVQKLALFGVIEFKGKGTWNHYKVFRAREK